MIDITQIPSVIEIINAALNNGKVVEIKNESRTEKPNIVVVETSRKVLTTKLNKSSTK